MKRISRNHHAVDRCRNPFQHIQLDHAEVSTGLRQKRTTPSIVQYVRCTSGFGRFVNYPMRSQCCMRAGVKERNYAADKQAKQISIRKRHRCCGSLSWRMLPSTEREKVRSTVQWCNRKVTHHFFAGRGDSPSLYVGIVLVFDSFQALVNCRTDPKRRNTTNQQMGRFRQSTFHVHAHGYLSRNGEMQVSCRNEA